jgi:salicylate hydroxylase
MLPHAGQGANQAIEDGVALAAILAQSDRTTVPHGLQVYESVRRERTAGVQRLARSNGAQYETSNDLDTRDRQISNQSETRAWMWNYNAEAEAAAAMVAR